MASTAPSNTSEHIIVMGVSGCGKSTLARAIAQQLGWHMLEGDDDHPSSNLDKMARGQPLSDADRAPWLAALNTKLKQRSRTVLSCSALKADYRACLGQNLPIPPLFVHVHGDYSALLRRVQQRPGHFMPASLLASQFQTLEMPDEPSIRCVTVSTELTTAEQLKQVLAFFNRQ